MDTFVQISAVAFWVFIIAGATIGISYIRNS